MIKTSKRSEIRGAIEKHLKTSTGYRVKSFETVRVDSFPSILIYTKSEELTGNLSDEFVERNLSLAIEIYDQGESVASKIDGHIDTVERAMVSGNPICDLVQSYRLLEIEVNVTSSDSASDLGFALMIYNIRYFSGSETHEP